MRYTITLLASLSTLAVPSLASAQRCNGQACSSAYSYYPAAVYYVAPRVYAPPPTLWQLADSAGQNWTHADYYQLIRWVDQRNAVLAATSRTPAPSPPPKAEPVPDPTPPLAPPPVARVKVKVHYDRYPTMRLEQMLKDAGLTITHQTYEIGYPLCGVIDLAKLNALRSLPGVTRIEVLK